MKKTDTLAIVAIVLVLLGSYLPWVTVNPGTLALESPLERMGLSPLRIYLILPVIPVTTMLYFTDEERTDALFCLFAGLAALLAVGYGYYGVPFSDKFLSVGSYVTIAGGVLYLLSASLRYTRSSVQN
mgnify:CR=1 FL=1